MITAKKPRKDIPRMSAKKLALLKQQGVSRPFSTVTGPKTHPKPVNYRRKKSEFARAYGSKERVTWVKSLGCLIDHAAREMDARSETCAGPMDNAHVETDGAGRKANADRIVPLCRHHHQEFDRYKGSFAISAFREAIVRCAETVEAAWQSRSRAFVALGTEEP
jgi:hypothetical protein